MKLSIMDNATDSLNRVVEYYAEGTTSGLKAAVKELISCIELLLKEKIRRLDLDPGNPVLLFTKLKISLDDKRTKYIITPISKTKTVTFDEAIERLEWLGEPISKPDQSMIGGLKKIRNALEHLEVNENPEEIKKVFAITLGVTIRFIEKYLKTARESVVDNAAWKTLIKKPEIYAEIEKSYKVLSQDILSAEKWLTGSATCCYCGSVLVVGSDGYYSGVKCKVCGHLQEFEMCYGCKNDFPIDELTPAEGDTYLCLICSNI
ncbi:MAG: hypothetical protein Q7R35_08500 [Elusimicrobiota bacterium]|nr:hypothetical protein [Elusimicrobiota bacterium]